MSSAKVMLLGACSQAKDIVRVHHLQHQEVIVMCANVLATTLLFIFCIEGKHDADLPTPAKALS